ncbi:MAG TPA: metalloregulator ArsR/SmtB family transcription factor [Steroidobacteraceae bacterium]|nr:metalloregulator ArsR/SmtB family transcription factor [Steroidobacteraceae bacterium]
MVTQQRARTTGAFGAIADPTRRAILDLLREGELSAGELAESFPVSRPAVSKHIRVLHRAGLVSERREAQSRIYALDARALAPIDAWLAPYRMFWSARLHDLKRVVESDLAPPRRPRTRGVRRRP